VILSALLVIFKTSPHMNGNKKKGLGQEVLHVFSAGSSSSSAFPP
jgi:hypothetical protein